LVSSNRIFSRSNHRGVNASERRRGLLAATALVAVISLVQIAGLTVYPAPAAAEGGGGGRSDVNGGDGGADGQAGADGTCGTCVATSYISGGGGGGGGGSGSTVGGAGGQGAVSSVPGDIGGTGGTAGTAGGAGGAGGNGTQFGEGGGGGGGGGGVNGSTTAGPATIIAPVSAGSGGAGGIGGVSAMPGLAAISGGGGGGGAGGIGLLVTGATSVSNLSTITGGAGGAGGAAGAATGGEAFGTGGQGGDGGAGIKFTTSGSTLTNSGTITGGAGGANAVLGAIPFGGAGVSGANLTIVNSGTIAGGLNQEGNVNSAIEFTGGANTLTLQPGWVLTGGISVSGSVTFNQSIDVNLGSKIGGDGAVIQNGTGTLTLSAANLYTGGTTISGGTLAATNGLSVGNGLVTLDGGTFQAATAVLTLINSFAINTTNGTVDTQANALTLRRVIADGNGPGALTKIGAGQLVLGDVNTYSGLTSINEGTLALGVAGACITPIVCFPEAFGSIAASSGVVVAAGAVFDLSNAHELSKALGTTIKSLAGTGTVVLGSGTLALSNAAGTFGGAINGDGGLTLTAGTQTLTGSNGYTGATTLNGGTLALSGAGSIAASSGVITATGAVLDISASAGGGATIKSLGGTGGTVTLGTKTLTLSNAAFGFFLPASTFSGAINGTGGLTLTAGSEALAGINGYTGATTITSGVLAIAGAGSIAASSGVNLTANSGLDITWANSGVTLQALAGAGGTVTLGSRTLTLSNASGTFGGAIMDAGGVTLAAGTQVLSGTNTYTGATTINGGTLALSGAGSIAASSGVSTAAGTFFDISASAGGGATIKSLAGTDGTVTLGTKTLTLSNASGTFGGAIDGSGGLTLTAGTETLTGSQGYSGATTINGGTLALSGAGSIAASSGVSTAAGAVLDLSASTGGGATIKSLAGSGGTVALGTRTLTLANASGTFGGSINGSGGLALSAGTETLTGNQGYSGATMINGGTLALSGAGSIAASSGVSTAAGAVLDIAASAGGGATIKSLAGSGGTVALGTKTLTLSNASGTFGGAINGSGGLALTAGTETLTASQGYSGATTINGGTLALSGVGSIASSSGVGLATGGTFNISASAGGGATIKSLAGSGGTVALGTRTLTLSNASGTFGGAFAGSGGLTLTGGTETLTGNSSAYTGTVNINAGRLLMGAGGTLGNGAATVNVNTGGTLGGTGTVGGNVAVNAGGILSAGFSPGTLTISGDLVQNSGAISTFELGQSGIVGGASNDLVNVGGNLTMGGTLNLTPPSAGWYRLYNVAGTISGSYDTVNSGALNNTIYATIPNQLNVLLAGTGQIVQFWDGADATGNGTVNGGTGTWSAANTNMTSQPGAQINDQWRGGVGVFAGVAGTVTIAGTQSIQGLQFTVDGYSLTGGTLTMTGDPFSDPSKSFITTDAGVTATIGSTIAGAGIGLTKQGAGTLILTGTNSYDGGTTINAGTLQIGDGGTTGSIIGDITNNAVLAINRSDTLTFANIVSGTGALHQNGSGTLVLTGTNLYTGGTTINAGILQIGDGGTTGSIVGDVTNNAILAINRSDTLTFAGVVSGTGALQQNGSGTLILTGTNIYTGGTTINAGTLQLGNGGTTGSLVGDVVNNSVLAINRTDALTLPGDISGSGALQQNGSGTLVLTGTSTYTGGTTISAGTLQLGNGGTTGSIAGDVTNNAILAVNRSDTLTFANIVSGSGALQQNGSGTLILTGTNIYTGGTTINAGTLQIGDGGTTGSIVGDIVNNSVLAINRTDALTLPGDISGTGALQQNGSGTLILTGTNLYTGGTTISAGTLQLGNGGTAGSIIGDVVNNSVLAVNRSDALTLPGVISGTGALQQNGAGTLILTGTNLYTGGTTINAGTLQIGDGGTTGSIVGDVVNNAILAINRSDALTLPGDISGIGVLQQNGTGVTTLAGAASYLGATMVNAGTLRANAANRFSAASAVTIAAGAVLDANGFDQTIASLTGAGNVALGAGRLTLANAASTTFSGAIAGTGGLTLAAGTQTLSGVSSYTGATAITGGTLIVNGSILSSSGVTVAAGGSIGGSGQLPSLTLNGTVSPGNSPGTLTVNGNLVLGAGSIYVAEIQGAVSDRITVTGTASLAGTLRLVPLGGAFLFTTPYTLLAAAGGRTGSFSPVDTAGVFGDGVTTSVAYTATEVQLTLTSKPLAPIVVDPTPTPASSPGSGQPSSGQPGLGRSTNAYAVARGIDAAVANGADPSVLFAIYNLPAAAIPGAVNQLSGEAQTAAPAMANSAAGQFLRTMLDSSATGRLANGPAGAAGFTADLPSRQDGAVRASLDPARFSLWGASFGSTGRTDGDRAVGSANRNLSDGHLAVGADIRLGSTTVVGAAVSGGQSRASLAGGLGKAQADVFQAGVYGRTFLGPVNLGAALGYARLDTDTSRAIPALARTGVAASYVTQAWSGRIEASLPMATIPMAGWGGFTVAPFAAFQAVQAKSPAAVERDKAGATAGMLTLARRSDMTSRSELGLQLDATLMLGATPVTGFVRAAWARYYQRDADLTASINGLAGASFSITGARPDRNAALLSAGADIKLSPSVSLGMRLDSELAANTRRIGATAQLKVSF
jgi:fibronectin-binding autotransporter adhesin